MKQCKPKRKKMWILLLLIPVIWLILAQFVPTFRTADHDAQQSFAERGVSLVIHTYRVGDYLMHYTQTGNDTLPTLLFIHGSPGSWNAFSRYMQDKGHSMGGPLAVRLDIDFPGEFSGLVLLAASVSPYLEEPEKWRPLLFMTPLNYWVPGAMRPANQELWYLKSDLKKMEPDLAKLQHLSGSCMAIKIRWYR